MTEKPDGPTALGDIIFRVTGLQGGIRPGQIAPGIEFYKLGKVPGHGVIEFNRPTTDPRRSEADTTRIIDEINHMFGPGTARRAVPGDYIDPAHLQRKTGIVVPEQMFDPGAMRAINPMSRATIDYLGAQRPAGPRP